MPLINIPDSLRSRLGDEASNDLAELIRISQENQRSFVLELVEDRFALRLKESESRLTERMDSRFLDIEKQFSEVHRQIAGVHAAIASQTRWLLTLLLGALVLYPLISRLMTRLIP
jgi:hypothetical protein